MPEQHPDAVRTDAFDASGPVDIDVDIPFGRVAVHLGETSGSVEIRHDPGAQLPWTESVAGILSWVGDRFGTGDSAGSPEEAIGQCRIEHEARIDHDPVTLVVRGPQALPLHGVPLAVTVHAPAGSAVRVRAAAGPVTVTGTAHRLEVTTGAGEVRVGDADGPATIRAGSGDVTAGALRGGAQLRASRGAVTIAALPATGSVTGAGGAVRLGEVAGDVLVRTSSGDVTVADAVAGSLEATTGSGTIRIGIRSGVAAEIDLSSGSGRATSELDVADRTPDRDVPLAVRARTGSGDAVVTRAVVTAAG
ncbi:DUF4097 family beta strand repeat-containing protein [Prauserella halophila]|uniref:DUF4097 family beta strand repeat-containing protein n=1 Tax=Prauserella halophila TaxID=185641 RepID=A0ABN1VXI5_9PSEU|nr:DUF4097 family beta strand repeat-containing protein [Prauserella halophila]MCP2234411.1 protein of unknown function (DUF4098) [Prauserella halophila]